ncbi:hypothetical protein OJ998_22080 [Solirubrobacter taibaiensis]|nr:hypothetical protein [Solirubrobacter taibaiensis]
MRAVLIAALAWLVVVAAAPAQAAEVHLGGRCYREDCDFDAIYTAAPGEANRLTVERLARNTLVFRDTGAVLRPGSGCVTSGDAVVCTDRADVYYTVKAALGDGDDVATSDGELDGGPGDDVLTAGLRARGGPGRDRLKAQFIVDDDGAHAARDRYEGQSVSYEGRRTNLRIDLRAGRAGEDVLVGVHNATGGSGDDVLLGTNGADELVGGPGDDRIGGLGGDDRLFVRDRDRVDAGAGDDTITLLARPEARAQLRCGTGRDFVDSVGVRDFIAGDCERLAMGFSTDVRLRATLPDPRLAVLTANGCLCVAARFVIYAGRQTVGSARGRRDRVVLRLNALGRSLLRRDRRLAVRIELRERPSVESFRTVLRLR